VSVERDRSNKDTSEKSLMMTEWEKSFEEHGLLILRSTKLLVNRFFGLQSSGSALSTVLEGTDVAETLNVQP